MVDTLKAVAPVNMSREAHHNRLFTFTGNSHLNLQSSLKP